MSELPRRRLLAVTGTTLTAAVAGCSSSDNGDENEDNGDAADPDSDLDPDSENGEPDTESTTAVDGTVLGDITIDNLNATAHSVDVIVEFDGEIEAWETASLESDSGVTLERSWPSDPGEFRVTARLDEAELSEITSAERDPDCLNLFVRIDRDGDLAFLTNTDGGPCGDGAADLDDAEEE
ncbi:hypothetical protein GS429_05330 [Natronorubrum sp. JWXQ-INN-674]|uniref:Ig-like domain-containing protein n=1 Tax=Natronorubrum halalkaliphilum TaxID=2691917 RepID=A0A6B0VIY9_9EURY|nr:hypothetical protein [Natronorubrum halalkaliphilum]MXV61494.1 hypothetical protein [Natronorubrum halalkaliphilum]